MLPVLATIIITWNRALSLPACLPTRCWCLHLPTCPRTHLRCRFAAAAGLMPLRTRLGGETRLQQALCLDSLGRNQEAYDIYVKIESHSAPGVAKKAKRWVTVP